MHSDRPTEDADAAEPRHDPIRAAEDEPAPPSPRRRRIVNAVLCAVCAAALAMYLLAGDAPDPDAADSFTFDEDTAADAQLTARWIMITLFGALTLIFGWRAARGR